MFMRGASMVVAMRHGHFPEDGSRDERELMEAYAKQLTAAGVKVETGEGLGACGLLHVFGMSDDIYQTCRGAVEGGVQYVATPLYWNDDFPIHYKLSPPYSAPKVREVEPGAAFYRDRMMLNKSRRAGYILENAAVVFATGACEKKLLIRDFGLNEHRIVLLPIGVDISLCAGSPEPFREATGVKGDFILSVGEITRRRNQHLLLDATRDMDIDVVFAGAADEDAEYIGFCGEMSHDRASFLGELPAEILRSAYHAASACAQPGLCELPGMHCLGAALAGCPVAVTERGTAWDYLGGGAFYFDPEDSGSLTTALNSALAAGRNAELKRHLIKKFTWGKSIVMTANIYKGITQAGAASGSG